jgi:hypothetical protein
MTSGGAHRRSKAGFSFKRNGKRYVSFPALVQRWRKTVRGLSSIAGADRVGHRTGLANQQHLQRLHQPMNGAVWRNAANIALGLHRSN